MPRPRLAMRKVREVLRLALGEGLSVRDVGVAGRPALDCLRPPEAGRAGRGELAAARRPQRRRFGGVAVPARPAGDRRASAAGLEAGAQGAEPQGRDAHAAVARVQRAAPRRLPTQPVLRPLPAVQRHGRRRHAPGAQRRREGLRRLPRRSCSRSTTARPGRCASRPSCSWRCSGASSYLYAEARASQELRQWIDAHVHAFEFFGAVPAIVVCDNLRSG